MTSRHRSRSALSQAVTSSRVGGRPSQVEFVARLATRSRNLLRQGSSRENRVRMSSSVWVRDVALPLFETRLSPGTAGGNADEYIRADEYACADEYTRADGYKRGQASVVFCCVSQALLFFTDVATVGLDS